MLFTSTCYPLLQNEDDGTILMMNNHGEPICSFTLAAAEDVSEMLIRRAEQGRAENKA